MSLLKRLALQRNESRLGEVQEGDPRLLFFRREEGEGMPTNMIFAIVMGKR